MGPFWRESQTKFGFRRQNLTIRLVYTEWSLSIYCGMSFTKLLEGTVFHFLVRV